MDGKIYYDKANEQENQKKKKEYLSTLTEEQLKAYNRYWTKLRQQKFNEDKSHKEEYNKRRNEHIKQLREDEKTKDIMKEQNKKDNKNYRLRQKKKLDEINNKLNEVNKKVVAIQEGNDLINDLISKTLKNVRNQRRPKKYATDEDWKKAEAERVKMLRANKKAK